MSASKSIVTKNPEAVHGTACFAGTRVAAQSLFEHLEAGYNVDYFLEQFPSVGREQVLGMLEECRHQVEERAEATAAR